VDREALQRAAAEAVGTFALVVIGAGSIMATAEQDVSSAIPTLEPDLVAVALAHGLTIAIMASALGHISGGHFNPAVTIGFLVTRRMAPMLGAIYVGSQLAAAVLGSLFLRWIFPGPFVDAMRGGAPALEISAGRGLVLEAVLTFFLVGVVFATAADPRGAFKSIAGLAIGLTITVDVLAGGPLTGAAMNPARAFGPQLVEAEWADAWVWYLGPLAGGAAAALAYEFLYLRPLGPEPVGPPETGIEEPRPGDTAVA
jgi:aquaporin TIP